MMGSAEGTTAAQSRAWVHKLEWGVESQDLKGSEEEQQALQAWGVV